MRAPRALLTASMVMFAASTTLAQQQVTSFAQLGGVLKTGDTLRVTDANGRKTTGRLVSLTSSSLELSVRQTDADGRDRWIAQPPVAEQNVRDIRLERRDSVLSGALIGFAAGAAPAILFIAGRSRGSDPIQDPGTAASLILVPGAICAGIGAAIDAVIFERRTVYRAPGQQSSRLRMSAVVLKSTARGTLSIRF